MPEYKFLKYETHDDGRVVRILLNRPEARNAQNRGMLVELDEAFLHAEADDEVRVLRRQPALEHVRWLDDVVVDANQHHVVDVHQQTPLGPRTNICVTRL